MSHYFTRYRVCQEGSAVFDDSFEDDDNCEDKLAIKNERDLDVQESLEIAVEEGPNVAVRQYVPLFLICKHVCQREDTREESDDERKGSESVEVQRLSFQFLKVAFRGRTVKNCPTTRLMKDQGRWRTKRATHQRTSCLGWRVERTNLRW